MHPVTMLLNVLPALLLLLPELVAGFGNEYVHIKVHVPKDQAPSIAVDAEPAPPHKVIHHFHHHAPPHLRSRARAPPKPKTSPLLESVILSDLDKPLHMSEHADFLNHAKEIAEHLSESYAIKKPHPPPPPPKKKVNTYTIIEEKHRPTSYDDYESRPEHSVDTYRVIDSRPQHHHHAKHHHHHHDDDDDDDDDVGYHYSAPDRHYRHKSSTSTSSYSFAEPAPVEEHLDLDPTYSYSPPPFYPKSARAPAHTLEAPEESHPDAGYYYDYNSSGGSSASSSSSTGGSSSGFRPSTQLLTQSGYEDAIDAYAAPVPTSRHRRPGPVDWPSRTGFNSAASETYNGLDSYNVGHVQGLGSSGYQYPGPYL